MSVASDLAEYLEDQGIGTVGTDIFYYKMPADVANSIVLSQYEGQAPEHTCGSNGFVRELPRVQVRIRNTDEGTAQSLAMQCAIALSKIGNEVIEGVRYRSVMILGSPGIMFRDENNRPNYGFNCQVAKELD